MPLDGPTFTTDDKKLLVLEITEGVPPLGSPKENLQDHGLFSRSCARFTALPGTIASPRLSILLNAILMLPFGEAS